jgi:uncharacterized protein YceH (UPF0502 family)
MEFTEQMVEKAIDGLRHEHRLVWHVTEHGSRVAKYKHRILEKYDFSPCHLAIMCELMLRGPQTQGELRSHTQRLCKTEGLAEIRQHLEELMDWGVRPLVAKLRPATGRREPRYAHLLCGDTDLVDPQEHPAAPPEPGPETEEQKERLGALEQEVAALKSQIGELQEAFDRFQKQFE